MDTIAAKATASGPGGALGVIRLSGSLSTAILEGLTPSPIASIPDRTATLMLLSSPLDKKLLDQALVTIFRSPTSYTGEDVVEITCHGGSLLPELVLQACLDSGARRAEPGEFTRRAVLNGKMDLIQAEAVSGLVGATSRAAHEASLHQLEKGLSKKIGNIKANLINLQAALASHIDFPEEDEAPASLAEILSGAIQLEKSLKYLLASAPEGELLKEGAVAVLAGPPNSGKSSLYNTLLGLDRAIVSDVPGTTRDAIEASVSLGGFPFRLVDTAGIRLVTETVEQLGVEVAKEQLRKADVVLFCLEAGATMEAEAYNFINGLNQIPVVLCRTKMDLWDHEPLLVPQELQLVPASVLGISSLDNTGIPELRKLLPDLVYTGLVKTGVSVPLLMQERQTKVVGLAKNCITEFILEIETQTPVELACARLQLAENYLEELTGAVLIEDVLDRLFASHCIGK